ERRRRDAARERLPAVLPGGLGAADQERRGAVVERRGVAGRHRAVRFERGLQLRQRLERRVGARRLVVGEVVALLPLLDVNRDELRVELSGGDRGFALRLAVEREA